MKTFLTRHLRRAFLFTLVGVAAVTLMVMRRAGVRFGASIQTSTAIEQSLQTSNSGDRSSQTRGSADNNTANTETVNAQSDVELSARGADGTQQPIASQKQSYVPRPAKSEKSKQLELDNHNERELELRAAGERDRDEVQFGEEEEEKRKQDQPDQAIKWRLESMVDETGTIPEGAEMRAWIHARQMPIEPQAWPSDHLNQTDSIAGVNPTGWQWLGPGNIGGRVRSIIVHPSDPQTLWVGSVSGGIWKSTNGGASWSALDDFMTNLAVTTMVIDPTNPNVIYAGTGEGFGNQDSIRGAGVFKTTNGGTTWTQLPSTATSSWFSVNRLSISPVDNQIILAGTSLGIWRSTDGGNTWTNCSTTRTLDINFHPIDGSKAIASGTGSGAQYSNDGGLTWNQATGISGLRVEVAYARSNPAIVYAGVESGSGQVYKSTDGGQSYSLVSTPNHLNTQGWYDNALWVDPTNPNNVVIGGINLFRSSNGGSNFSQFANIHSDQHIIVEAPGFDGSTNKTVYFGNDGGIYRTTDINAASVVTTELNNNLGITQFYGGAGNHTSGRIIGGTQDNGTLRYTGNTETWNFMNGGDGGWSASDPTDPNYFYGEFQWLQIHRSSNGGTSSQTIYSGITDAVASAGTTNFISPFILDPNNANVLLAGGANLWRTTNAKGVVPLGWTIIKPTVGSNISAITVAKGNSDIVWVGHNNGSVYVSTDGTAAVPTWTQVDNNAPGLPDGRRATRITVDPTNANRVYVTFGGFTSGNVWRSDNAGASWTNITNNLPAAPVRSIVVWQDNPNYLYVGTEVGVFASANGGLSWSPSNDGPTNCSVDELFWMGNTLVAATHGRGMFSINISTGQPPSVSITNPTSGASFSSGSDIQIDATASDTDGTIAKVDFFEGSNLIGTDMTSPYSVTWLSAPSGAHLLTAKATDNSGDATVSGTVNITVAGGNGSNDNFVNAQPLNGQTGTVLGTNVGATEELGEPDHDGNAGGASVWYTWQAPTSGTVAITTAGSSFDTLLAVYTGNSVTALTFVISNDDEQGLLTSRVDFNVVGGQLYRIAIDGYNSGSGPGTGSIVLTLAHGSITPSTQFTFGSYFVTENGGVARINIFRAGPTSSTASVDYRTSDDAALTNCSVVNNIASARCDYATSVGTVRFAANETLKTITIPIVDDSYAEGNETFTITLSTPSSATLGAPSTATITITDNESSNGANPIDGTSFFVRQQYVDFLNREPDPAGAAAWQTVINNCPQGDTTCDRIHVSSSFFRSPEFQDRGYFVYRFYPVSFGRKPEFVEFVPDIAKVSGFLSDADLEAAKLAFIAEFMSRPEFEGKFNGLNNTQYVDTLLSTAGITNSARDFWIAALENGTRTRAEVLREISESTEVYNKYYNQAFVVMQYFGYLRRDPDGQYLAWIAVLDSTGDFRGMINGFMNSLEYRFRFGP